MLLIAVLLVLPAARTVRAGQVLDQVRRNGVMRCVAGQRPPIAMARPDDGVDGLAVELCRAVAIAVLGPAGRVEFTLDGSPERADLAFIPGHDARFPVAPGPVVFVERLAVMVPLASSVHSKRDLDGATVCLTIGSPEHGALEAMVHDLGIDITRLAFEEAVEMHDAYAVGRCGAMVGAWGELSGLLGPMGVNRLISRLLAEPMALVPVIAATGTTDPDWAAIVSRVVRSVLGEPGAAMPPNGVRSGWLDDASAAIGRYRALARGIVADRY